MSRSPFLLLGCCLLASCAQTITSNAALPDASTTLPDASTTLPDVPPSPLDAAVDVVAPIDAGEPVIPPGGVSDDCRRETWCWERPFPTGETPAAAVATSADALTYVTEGGTLVRWDGTRWRTQALTLPGRATGVWVGADGEVVLTVVEALSQRERWIVELRGAASRVIPLAGQGYVSNPRAAGDALWVQGTRELYRRRGAGAAWETIDGPGNDVLVAGMHAAGPDEAVVLESWGSGSGAGIVHRWREGVWDAMVDFRDRGYRVEGPIAAHAGSLWMRTSELGSGQPGVVRVTGDVAADVEIPRGLGSINLYAVGSEVWLVDGNRAWRRAGDAWAPVEGFPGRPYGVIAGFDDRVAWVLSEGVHRLRGDAWERLAEGDRPTGRFWERDGTLSLVSYRPAGFLSLGGAPRPTWQFEAVSVSGDFVGDARPVGGVGALATARGAMLVRGRTVGGLVPWPNQRAAMQLGASQAGLWAWPGEGRLVGYVDGAWTELPAPTFDDVRGSGGTIDAVHVTADARLFVAATLITGDKQVRRRVFVRDGDAWRVVVAEMGVFGRTEPASIVGETSRDVWIGLAGLHRYDGATATRVAADLDVQALWRRADGVVTALTPTAVETYGLDGMRAARVTLPPVRAAFSQVHQAVAGALRVANASGQVMRYTP